MLTARELCEGMAQTFIDPPLTSDADADLTSGHFKEWTIMDLINSRPHLDTLVRRRVSVPHNIKYILPAFAMEVHKMYLAMTAGETRVDVPSSLFTFLRKRDIDAQMAQRTMNFMPVPRPTWPEVNTDSFKEWTPLHFVDHPELLTRAALWKLSMLKREDFRVVAWAGHMERTDDTFTREHAAMALELIAPYQPEPDE